MISDDYLTPCECGYGCPPGCGCRYSDDDRDDSDEEMVLVCDYPGCCMPGYHFRSECHNAEDYAAMEKDADEVSAGHPDLT